MHLHIGLYKCSEGRTIFFTTIYSFTFNLLKKYSLRKQVHRSVQECPAVTLQLPISDD